MKSIFTIVTNSHVPQGLAALNSIRSTLPDSNKNFQYTVITTDYESYTYKTCDNITIAHIKDINLPELSILLNNAQNRYLTKYEQKQNVNLLDTVRWALKPCLIQYLLRDNDECIYIDSDLYFINSVANIISNTKNISLSPHFRPYGTTEVFYWMKQNNVIGDTNVFTDGYFNGGFVIIKNTSIANTAINWWKRCCLNRCEINKEIGLYVDQKYLDYMYMYFDDIDKINDLGCNMAEWNIYSYNISDLDLNSRHFIINNKFIPKFFHFSGSHFKYNHIMNFFHKEFTDKVLYYNNLLNA